MEPVRIKEVRDAATSYCKDGNDDQQEQQQEEQEQEQQCAAAELFTTLRAPQGAPSSPVAMHSIQGSNYAPPPLAQWDPKSSCQAPP